MASRNNHYVPRWHQEGFFEPGQNTLAYLDLTPPVHRRRDGSSVTGRALFNSPISRCFVERDLYSTFFGASVNDEIERKLFGAIDTRGAPAVRAFTTDDVRDWHTHFQTLFSYIDIQKVRTPKGLDWLRAQYPDLTQNELMQEMQGIRLMNCTIWTEGVRELVSAEDAGVKFILSDHPVTVCNPGLPPDRDRPYDPSITLKGSQTLFPLSRDFCLILTNLEFAEDRDADPLQKRTFARHFRNSLVRTDSFIRTRKLTDDEVSRINMIQIAGARRYVAAGRPEWLEPQVAEGSTWAELCAVLRPPENGLWGFGGELYAKFDDGHVHYQDAFGRTEKPLEALQKTPPKVPRGKDPCGCGSDRTFGSCCEKIPEILRPSWSELSIRERNLSLYRAAVDIFGLDGSRTWTDVRRDMTDEKISDFYKVFASFWPLETDLLKLLPKPDGRPRAIYTGSIHPEQIVDFAMGAGLYFGEVLIEHPMVHARTLAKEFSPVENPRSYRQEILKTLSLFLALTPLIDLGLVNLVPDPCAFDPHLRDQMMHMARARAAGRRSALEPEARMKAVIQGDVKRSLMLMPREALEARLAEGVPGLEGLTPAELVEAVETFRLQDPLVSLQPGDLGDVGGGQLTMMKLAPNFEMAMYLAQATGAAIVTDSRHRWQEVVDAILIRGEHPQEGLQTFSQTLERLRFQVPRSELDVLEFALSGEVGDYPGLMSDAFRYLLNRGARGAKPNFEAQLAARVLRLHGTGQMRVVRRGVALTGGRLHVAAPARPIRDNTVNRLLLMSSSEHHLPGVPLAFYFEPDA